MYKLCPFSILQMTQELNIGKEMQQGENVYQETIRIKELCPHVHNSIKEFLPMPLFSWSTVFDCGAGKAPGTFCGATAALVSFSLGMPPLFPFPGVCQGISPVQSSCS